MHHTKTPTYHPQTNPPVERANRTLKTMVASYLKERHTTWDEKLPELLFAMNTAVHSSTGIIPAMLLYGRQPEPPGTQRRLREVAAKILAQDESLARWKERMDALPRHQRAASQSRVAQDRQASYYDAGRREPDFKPGDRVWKRSHPLSLATKGIAVKLAPKFEGPYWITAVLGSNTYRLVSEGGQVEEVVAADQMKTYHGESPEASEVDLEGGSEKAPVSDLPVSQEAEATPKKDSGETAEGAQRRHGSCGAAFGRAEGLGCSSPGTRSPPQTSVEFRALRLPPPLFK